MPSTWNIDSDRKLFLAIIEVTGVKTTDWDAVVEKMGPGYTKEAVRQHFAKIKKATGHASTPTKAAPKTPTKNGTPTKTPKSNPKSNKRKLVTPVGEDDDDDDDDDDEEEQKPTIDLTNGNSPPIKKLKTENDLPSNGFKTETVGPEGQIDLNADDDIYD